MERFVERLSRHRLIALDTSIFIYHLEANPRYQALAQTVLTGVQEGEWTALTSVLTLMEVTVRPWQLQEAGIAREYETLIVNFPNLSLVDVTRDVTRQAAKLRAAYRVRPADALQAATALIGGATAMVTNDRGLTRLAPELDVILLGDYAVEEEEAE